MIHGFSARQTTRTETVAAPRALLTFIGRLVLAACFLTACSPGAAQHPAIQAAADTPASPTSSRSPQPSPTGVPTVAATPTTVLTPLIPPTITPEPIQPAAEAPALLLPDAEVVYSPTALDFDPAAFLIQADGYLAGFREYLASTGWTSAADVLMRVARESSINPRLLLALIEYQNRCVLGQPDPDFQIEYLMGDFDFHHKGFYRQLSWVASQLSAGYYGWRDGTLSEFSLVDGIIVRPAPDLNPGSVALQFYFSRLKDQPGWQKATDPDQGLVATYKEMFADPWKRSAAVEPLLPDGLTQPELILPFEIDRLWSLTSGPHPAWDIVGAQAALDFAPSTNISGCVRSDAWVVAAADGTIVRAESGAVIQDISGDNIEQTGWAILYMHIANEGRVSPGSYLHAGDPVGHPSCEGGRATGTHLHIARKYNGEWIAAGGSIPFVLSGWTAHNGPLPYQGSLTRDELTVTANLYGISESHIVRKLSDD